jgi:Putative O-methyltransferase
MTSQASFEAINYSIRPAKATQRHMIAEAVGRLAAVAPLHLYQYIGFGSTFFIDFKLLHRQYGIKHMTSVEIEVDKKPRFDFNKPYSAVKMHYGSVADFLVSPMMNWRRRSIIWLDYDYRMSSSVLADIDRVIERSLPGSMLVVTVDAEPPSAPMANRRKELEEDKIDLEELLQYVDGGRLSKLGGSGLAQAYRDYATDTLTSKLRATRPELDWEQIFHFRYEDGHRMLTFGGVLVDDVVRPKFRDSHFEGLPFHRDGAEPFEITVPNLTPPEIHKLAQRMPRLTRRDRESLARLSIASEDVENYHALYRYLPAFVESMA